jgi:hypothetical protein
MEPGNGLRQISHGGLSWVFMITTTVCYDSSTATKKDSDTLTAPEQTEVSFYVL